MTARKHERIDLLRRARWDFFTGSEGGHAGYVTNISRGGCMLKANRLIEHRRWLRILIPDGDARQTWTTVVGRVIRCEHQVEAVSDDIILYRYGVEFIWEQAQESHLDLIFAFSSKNEITRSCLSLNTKSS